MTTSNLASSKWAIVTGGTGGIGRAIAEELAEAGYHVIAAGLNPPSESSLPNLSFHEVDLTQPAEVEQLVASAPTLEALVNAAGVISRQREFELKEFNRVVEINLTAAMRVCMAAHDKLAESAGSIVHIASMLSYFGGGLVPAYSASKGGIVQLTKSLAIAWAADGIRVNAVAPGWIETAMTEPLRTDPSRNSAILERTPMRRWGSPEEIAAPVKFLLSQDASFITGSILNVDGGYSSC